MNYINTAIGKRPCAMKPMVESEGTVSTLAPGEGEMSATWPACLNPPPLLQRKKERVSSAQITGGW
jgi:hypothetical protein